MEQFIRLFKNAVEEMYRLDKLISNMTFEDFDLDIRIAEYHIALGKVEAYYNVAPLMQVDIDLLRKRVGMPTLTEVKPVVESWWPDYGYPISDNLAIVRQERRVELAGEGYRQNDWKRWRAHKLFDGKRHKGFPYDPKEYQAAGYNPNILLDEAGYIDPYQVSLNNGTFHFRSDRDYLSPIPINELLLNKNLKQNPGWDE